MSRKEDFVIGSILIGGALFCAIIVGMMMFSSFNARYWQDKCFERYGSDECPTIIRLEVGNDR